MQMNRILERSSVPNDTNYIQDEFGNRTMMEMELALAKARDGLPRELDNHNYRSQIARHICARVQDGERTFGGMVKAAMSAVDQLKGAQMS
jgi:hypothetical protein